MRICSKISTLPESAEHSSGSIVVVETLSPRFFRISAENEKGSLGVPRQISGWEMIEARNSAFVVFSLVVGLVVIVLLLLIVELFFFPLLAALSDFDADDDDHEDQANFFFCSLVLSFHKNSLNELDSQRGFAHTAGSQNDNFVLPHNCIFCKQRTVRLKYTFVMILQGCNCDLQNT